MSDEEAFDVIELKVPQNAFQDWQSFQMGATALVTLCKGAMNLDPQQTLSLLIGTIIGLAKHLGIPSHRLIQTISGTIEAAMNSNPQPLQQMLDSVGKTTKGQVH